MDGIKERTGSLLRYRFGNLWNTNQENEQTFRISNTLYLRIVTYETSVKLGFDPFLSMCSKSAHSAETNHGSHQDQ